MKRRITRKNGKESKTNRKQSMSSVKSDSSVGANTSSGNGSSGSMTNGTAFHNSAHPVNGIGANSHGGQPSNKDSF